MTVTYTAKVATSSFSCFLKLLARWHGSIYKLLWKDFILFAFLYYLLSFIYRFVLDEGQKRIFEMVAKYCDMRNSLIPIAFVLGFYVSIVMTRYFTQLGHIPWPDHMATFVTANVHGLDERGRLMRRTMLRYFNLAYAITMSSISQSVKKNFPTFQHFVKSGLMTQNEMEILNKIKTEHNKFFIPLGWTTALVTRARKEGRIKDDFAVKTLVDEINSFRNHLATLFVYDMISMPLVYTQVVTIAVYTFFLACLMGRQFVEGNAELPDMYFPFFTFLEYLFYMGWLKVAESFVNPFGEDDDDFNILFLIKRNLQVSYLLVDEIHNEHPDLIRDQYWDENNFDVPFTKPTFDTFQAKNPMNGSANDLSAIGVTQKEIQLMETLDELDEIDAVDGVYESPKSPTSSSFIPIIGSLRNIVPSTRSSRRPLLSRSDSKQNPDRPAFVGGPKFQVGSVDTVFQPSSPSASVPLKEHTFGPASTSDEPMQFKMDEDTDHDTSGRELLADAEPQLSFKPPPDVFELQAVLSRHLSQASGHPQQQQQQQPRQPVSAAQAPSNNNEPVGQGKDKARMPALRHDSLEWIDGVDDSGQMKSPARNAKSPNLTVTIPSITEADPATAAAAQIKAPAAAPSGSTVDGGDSGSKQRERFVAPPSQTPDVPLSPEPNTPLWILNQPPAKNK